MKRKLILLFLGASVCTYLGYSSLQAQRDRSAGTDPAVKDNRVPALAPAPSRAVARTKNPVAANTDAGKGQNTLRTDNGNATEKPTELKVVNALDRNPQLSSRLKPLLPPRTTLTDAAAGFKNQGQFIAALHVSKNLGIPFNQIKAKMTGEKGMSLKDAIRELRPEMEKKEAKAEVKRAEGQAKLDENQAKTEAKLIASGRS
jgi:hypothetical protein